MAVDGDDPLILADDEYHKDLLYSQHSVVSHLPNSESSWITMMSAAADVNNNNTGSGDDVITIRRYYEYLETEDSLKGILSTLLFVFIVVIMVVVALTVNPRM